jgi:predicted AlkP superfamily pyrophosphatase or phosphodiesterase
MINGRRPTFQMAFNDSLKSVERVEKVLEWIDEEKGPQFLAIYLSAVDHAGHWDGPESENVTKALGEIDQAIAYLIDELKRRDFYDSTDIIIVSDHGMTEQPRKQLVPIESLVTGNITSKISWIDYGPVTYIIPQLGQLDILCGELEFNLWKNQIPCQVYRRENIPQKYQYRQSDRIAPLVVECSSGWALSYERNTWIPKGQHGYDPYELDMYALLIAHGSRIKENLRLSLWSNIDVYPLLAELLNIEAMPCNGTNALSSMILRV